MEFSNVSTGIFLGVLAGVFLGSFAFPMKKVKIWQWEHTWILFSLWATVVLPLIMAVITIPNLMTVYTDTSTKVLITVFSFGALWGIANIGYGMGLKMIGLAMGTAIVLGLSNAIGAIFPIILFTPEKLLEPVGITLCIAVAIMVVGIVVCALAGLKREKALNSVTESTADAKKKSEFIKGLIICVVAGVFGAMFNFALISGKPIEIAAIGLGASPMQAANPTWVIALTGGFVVTLAYCVYLWVKNNNIKLFFSRGTGVNWALTLGMGVMWYAGVTIYGMSVSKLGILGASIGWPVIQSMAVGSGNFWGIVTGEWKGSGKAPLRLMITGLLVLVVGIVIVGIAATLDN